MEMRALIKAVRRTKSGYTSPAALGLDMGIFTPTAVMSTAL